MPPRFAAAVCLLFCASGVLTAAPPPNPSDPPTEPEAVGKDLYGDSLPPGAIARFGTVRLRAETNALAIRPDGKTLVTSGQGLIRDWDADTGEAGPVHRLPGSVPMQTFLSPDGKTLATRGPDGLFLWDAVKGEQLHKLSLDEGCMITQAVFAPDGCSLATAEYAGAGGPIRLWNVADGKGRLLVEHAGAVMALAFAQDGERIAAAAGRGKGALRCWDPADGKELWRADAEDVFQLAFSPDGRTLVSVAYDGDAPFHLWDAATGQPADHGKPPTVHRVTSVRFGPDADTLAVAASDGVVVWDLKAGKELHRFAGARGPFAFSPDGRTLTGFVGQTLQRWDLATGKALYDDTRPLGHLAPVEAVAYSADGKLLASVAFDSSVRIWDVASQKVLHILPGHEGYTWAWAAFTPDGATLVTAGGDDTIRFWDVGKGKEVRRLEPRDLGEGDNALRMHSFHLSMDGKTLIAVRPDPDPTGMAAITGMGGTGTLTVWDAATGERRSRRTVQNPRHTDVFSADGRWMAVQGGDVFDTATGDRRLTLQSKYSIGTPFGDAFAFSPDGAFVAGALVETVTDGTHFKMEQRGIQVWELATGAPVARIPTKEFCRFAFAPDGRTLATVGPDAVRLWDVVAARELYSQPVTDHLLGPYGSAFAFAPDGRSLAVAASDTTVLMWDLSSAYHDAVKPPPLTKDEADALWSDLADADAAKAYAAVNRLASRPAEALSLLRDRLRPAAPVPAERLQHWIADLNDDDFSVRDAATRQLAGLGPQPAPALRDALAHDPSPEQRRRITGLLDDARLLRPGDALRGVRGVRALERIASPDARRVLKELAAGDPAAAATQEERDSLARTANQD